MWPTKNNSSLICHKFISGEFLRSDQQFFIVYKDNFYLDIFQLKMEVKHSI